MYVLVHRKRATDPGAVKHSGSTDDFSEPKRKKKINPKKESEPSNSFSDEKDGIVPSNFKVCVCVRGYCCFRCW